MLVLLARPRLHVAWEWPSAFVGPCHGDAEAQGFAFAVGQVLLCFVALSPGHSQL